MPPIKIPPGCQLVETTGKSTYTLCYGEGTERVGPNGERMNHAGEVMLRIYDEDGKGALVEEGACFYQPPKSDSEKQFKKHFCFTRPDWPLYNKDGRSFKIGQKVIIEGKEETIYSFDIVHSFVYPDNATQESHIDVMAVFYNKATNTYKAVDIEGLTPVK